MKTKKLPHEIKSEETKQKIMDATKRLLAEYDFKYLTVRNICEESGAAYGSFYHHFESKENLLYMYTNDLYQQVRALNPLPDWIDPKDYVKKVLWYAIVYGAFCEAAGEDLIRYLYQNCPQEMFQQTMDEEVSPAILQASDDGYIDHVRDRKNGVESQYLLVKDVAIVCKGVVFWWCGFRKGNEDHLYETIEHLAFNMLFSFSNEDYQNSDFPRLLVTEMEQFKGSLNIPNLGFAHEEK